MVLLIRIATFRRHIRMASCSSAIRRFNQRRLVRSDHVFFQLLISAFRRLTCFICLDSGHLLLWNFFSTVPVDVLVAKSYEERLFL